MIDFHFVRIRVCIFLFIIPQHMVFFFARSLALTRCNIRHVVLDEADRMFEDGFAEIVGKYLFSDVIDFF